MDKNVEKQTLTKKNQKIPYARQDISEEDIKAVRDSLSSDYLTQGPMVPHFEKLVSEYVGVSHAVAVNSATSALHIACRALDVKRGDVVWTSPNTFVASANSVLYCGASVDFVDIDPKTYNLSIDKLEEKLIHAKKIGKLPKVIIPVHFAGQPCEMSEIFSLSKKYNFKIIEDAAHAIGGKYKDDFIGACKYSDITIFSFHPVKIITSGEGGMAVTEDPEIANKLRLLRSHGITSAPDEMDLRPSNEIWNYQQIDLGFNYRMTDIHAALGCSQIKRLNKFIQRRHKIAERYNRELNGQPITLPWQHPDSYSSYHLYVIRLNLDEIDKTQKEVYNELRDNGILVNLLYIPVYRQPYYEKLGFKPEYCPEAENYFQETIAIPMYPGMTDVQQGISIDVIKAVLD